MSNVLLRKSFLVKLVSVILAVAVMFATATLSGTSFTLNASAESNYTFEGLQPQAQYTVNFSYTIGSTANYVAAVYGGSGDERLMSKKIASTSGSDSLTFCTVNYTSVTFKLEGSGTASITSASVNKDAILAPGEYYNEDFSSGNIKNWSLEYAQNGTTTLALGNNALTITPGTSTTESSVYSTPFMVTKGIKYELSFEVEYPNVADSDTLNILLVTAKNKNDRTSYRYSKNEDDVDDEFTWKLQQRKTLFNSTYWSDLSTNPGKNTNSTSMGMVTPQSGYFKVITTFTAHKTSAVYLALIMNKQSSCSVTNVVINEDNTNPSNKYKAALTHVGSAIRTEGHQGLRYKTSIDKLLLSENNHGITVTEYGTLAIKTDYLGGQELKADASYDYNGSTETPKVGVAYSLADGTNKLYEDKNGELHFTGVLINIAEKNYNASYTVRAYFKYVDESGNTDIIYAEQDEVAVYPVAKAAYSKRNSNNEFVESKTVRDYLYKNIITRYTDKVINVSNNSTAIYNNFQGISSTVYHGTIFFDDAHGRTYNDAQAQTEINRLVDSKVTNVRTRLASQWMWTDSGWDWKSDKMKAFYKWGNMLEDNGISITLNAGWQLEDFISFYKDQTHADIEEVNYLHGEGADLEGEATKADAIKTAAGANGLKLNLTDDELAHYSLAAARYGEWIKQALVNLKANGVTNVEYVIPFTETGYYNENDSTYSYDEWIIMTMGLHDALVDAEIRDDYKLIGPAQSDNPDIGRTDRFVEYIYSKIGSNDTYKDMIDINAMHTYPQPNSGYTNSVYDPEGIYSSAVEAFNYYDEILNTAGQRSKDFWCDEYFVKAADAGLGENIGMLGTQFAAGFVAGMNKGINRFVSWQMFDTWWDSSAAYTTGEFVGGIHKVGTCPALTAVDGKSCTTANCKCKAYTESSYVPRKTYYALNLLGKYMNNNSAGVLQTAVNDKDTASGELYTSAIKNDEGETVILIVNTMPTASTVRVNLETKDIINFSRYTYDPNEIVPTAEAKSLPSDKTISLNGASSFYDVIPAQSFAIYVEGGTFYGDDVDMPFEGLD